jgi:hypothetical protein
MLTPRIANKDTKQIKSKTTSLLGKHRQNNKPIDNEKTTAATNKNPKP